MSSWLYKHGAKILSALGIIGVGATAVMAVKATPAAMQHIEEAKAKTPMEKVKACWKDYIYAAAMGLGTATCIASAQFLNDRQISNLAGGLAGLEAMFAEYREYNKRLSGEETDRFIMHQMQSDDDPPWDEWDEILPFVVIFEDGYVEFRATLGEVCHAEVRTEEKLVKVGWVTVNEFLMFLHQDPIPGGDDIGWDKEITPWVDFSNPAKYLGDSPELTWEIEMSDLPYPITAKNS